MTPTRRTVTASLGGATLSALAAPLATAATPSTDPIRRVAILGCIRQMKPVPALVAYAAAKADLNLWIGDNVYVDTKDDPAAFAKAYAQLAQQPGFAELRAQGQHMATWDDHDYGANDADKTYALKEVSKTTFQRFWNLETDTSAPEDGVYNSRLFTFGQRRLHVIMLDVRWRRDAPDGRGDILGEGQWRWLNGRLAVPADLTLVISGTQILLNAGTGSETWEDYPRARDRLFKMVRRHRRQGVVFITGDQHYGEVARARGALGYDAVELQFCGLNQIEKPEKNLFRVSPVSTSLHSMCLLDIQWEADDYNAPHILYRVIDTETGATDIAYRLNFSELTFG